MSWNFSLGNLFQTQPSAANQAIVPRREQVATENVAAQPPALTEPPATFQEPTSTSTAQFHQDASEEASTVSFGVPMGGFAAGETGTAVPGVQRLSSQADSLDSMDLLNIAGGGTGDVSSPVGSAVAGGVISADASDRLQEIFNNESTRNSLLRSGFSRYPGSEAQFNQLLRSTTGEQNQLELETYTAALLNQENPMSPEDVTGVLNNAQQMLSPEANYPGLTAAGIAPTELMLSALHDVSTPSNINQRGLSSCAAGSAQMQMAIRQPAEYMDMVQTLASGNEYTFAEGGYTVSPDTSNMTDPVGVNAAGEPAVMRRTPSAMVMQNAFMEILDGGHNYNSGTNDQPRTEWQQQNMGGLLEAITGQDIRTSAYLGNTRAGQRAAETQNIFDNHPSIDHPILVGLRWGEGLDQQHAVNVVGLDDGQVRLFNPQGNEVTMPLAEFQDRLRLSWIPQ